MGNLKGKVAFITGAARRQGRSHAVRLAQEGADIIALDICRQIESVSYPMSTPDDLAETVKEVESLDRRIVAVEADVRDAQAVRDAVSEGLDTLGRLDIVIANAGIVSPGTKGADADAKFRDIIDVNLTGTWNTLQACAPVLIDQATGGAIVLISSTQGLTGRGGDGTPATVGYSASKHGVVGLMRSAAHWLAPHNIRVNSVHPTGVETPMIINAAMAAWWEERGADGAGMTENLLKVDMVQPSDISSAVAWLVSDEARYVTGVTLPVDAGFTAR